MIGEVGEECKWTPTDRQGLLHIGAAALTFSGSACSSYCRRVVGGVVLHHLAITPHLPTRRKFPVGKGLPVVVAVGVLRGDKCRCVAGAWGLCCECVRGKLCSEGGDLLIAFFDCLFWFEVLILGFLAMILVSSTSLLVFSVVRFFSSALELIHGF